MLLAGLSGEHDTLPRNTGPVLSIGALMDPQMRKSFLKVYPSSTITQEQELALTLYSAAEPTNTEYFEVF